MTSILTAGRPERPDSLRFPAVAAFALLPIVPEGGGGSVVLALLGAGIVAAALGVWRKHRPRRSARTPTAPPLIFPAAPASAARARTRPPPPLVPFASSPPPFPVPAASAAAAPASAGLAVSTLEESASAAAGIANGSGGPAAATLDDSGPAPALFEGQTIKFHVPLDGTLQILPGRLELVAGPDSGQVIRFVRTDGPPDVTFGRSDGPAYRHVQLRVPTVSRRHAQMRLDGNRWSIVNLSATNPLVVNGEELANGAGGRLLENGDRVEMGELIFVFRDR